MSNSDDKVNVYKFKFIPKNELESNQNLVPHRTTPDRSRDYWKENEIGYNDYQFSYEEQRIMVHMATKPTTKEERAKLLYRYLQIQGKSMQASTSKSTPENYIDSEQPFATDSINNKDDPNTRKS
uniref:Uncharacterized protein n=1 Tax=Panagrellus redivivus TaxID=6233 RepID=A0A7E4VBS7_PANRE